MAGLGSLVSAPIMGVNYMIFLRPPASDKVELAGRDEKSKFAPTITLSVEEVEGLSSAATEQAPILSHKEDKPTAVVSDITTHSTCSSNGSGDASVSPAVAAAIGAEVSTAISVQTTNKENNINVESAETEETEAQKNKDTAMKTILASAPSTIHVSAIDTVFRGKSSTTAAAGVLSSLSLSLLGLVSKSLLLFAATFLSYFISKGVSDWTGENNIILIHICLQVWCYIDFGALLLTDSHFL